MCVCVIVYVCVWVILVSVAFIPRGMHNFNVFVSWLIRFRERYVGLEFMKRIVIIAITGSSVMCDERYFGKYFEIM